MTRGFACSGTLAVAEIAATAREAEDLGYTCVWITVIRDVTDPAHVLDAALQATSTLEVGLGLVPLDAFPAGKLAPRLAHVPERAIVGLGVGQHQRDVPGFWRDGASAFRRLAPDVRICVGSYGAKVLRAAGPLVDAALLNWMTPERVDWARRQLSTDRNALPPCPLYVYIPAAIGAGGANRIGEARIAMAQYPYHRRHQASLGSSAPEVLMVKRPESRPALPDFGANATPVVNPTGPSSHAERRNLLWSCRPCTAPR
jgi:alkanesulfonate monooxygenase SsuD/methylene tetrahydromethanopterin reductase-like flavin-dependent oxidoreductase (luciferase family)